MKDQLLKVEEFHNKFLIPNGASPQLLSPEESILRYDLMKEENDEYLKACSEENLVEIADALGDKLYILLGTILKHGLQHKIEEVFEEIHGSNMSKLDNSGNPVVREDGKILKGVHYRKPDIAKVLSQ